MDSDFLAEYVHGRRTVREYFDRFVGEPLFEAAFADCPAELRDRCIAHLWSAFAELDAIPRTDPVWAGSNMRATFSKLRDHTKVVRADERDVERRWRTFVVSLCAGDLDLFRRASEALLRSGQLSVSVFVRTSLNLLDVSGWETDQLAADTLLQNDSAKEARSTLDDIIKKGGLERSLWAKKVLRRLGEAG
jgi:hypothetical protein